MKFFNFTKPAEQKDNPTGATVYMETKGQNKPKNLKSFYDEGYVQNVIVYRCIREITTAIGSVELEVHNGETVLEKHQALDLMKRPNPTEGYAQFVRHAFTEYLISGNMFITKAPDKGQAGELWVQSSQKMEVVGGPKGIPAEYVYNSGSRKISFPVDQLNGRSSCFHFKTFNPHNPFIGLPPMAHVALAADVHNNGLKWNSALLENGARPSGIFKFPAGVTVGVEEQSKWQEFVSRFISGPENAGRPVTLDNGGEWQDIGLTQKDMDYSTTMATMAKYIASAYGVPLPLVDNDAASYNNIEQAKERLWTDTVLPMLDEFLDLFSAWMLADFGQNIKFAYNPDSIPALEAVRAKRFDRMSKAAGSPTLTINESREAMGYGPVDNPLADGLLLNQGVIPISAMGDIQQDAAKAMKALGYSEADIKKLAVDIYGD